MTHTHMNTHTHTCKSNRENSGHVKNSGEMNQYREKEDIRKVIFSKIPKTMTL